MMARRLAVNVVMRHPETGTARVFEAGTVPPGWAADAITNDEVWADDTQASEVDGGGVSNDAAPEPTIDDAVERARLLADQEATRRSIEPERPPAPAEPPRHGAGSGREPWAAYATALGISVDEAAGRNDIIALVEALQL